MKDPFVGPDVPLTVTMNKESSGGPSLATIWQGQKEICYVVGAIGKENRHAREHVEATANLFAAAPRMLKKQAALMTAIDAAIAVGSGVKTTYLHPKEKLAKMVEILKTALENETTFHWFLMRTDKED